MIGPVIAATLPLMRAHAESLMIDRCDIHRVTSGWDEAEQATVTTWVPVHLEVPCLLEQPAVTSVALLTDEAVTRQTPLWHGPVTVVGVHPDDRITITAIGPVSDPEQLGAVVWVTHVDTDTHPVERLIECRWVR